MVGIYIGREEIREFFSQVYSSGVMLDQHASKFHGALVNGVAYGKLELSVRCRDCGGNIDSASCIRKRESSYNHRGKEEIRKLLVAVPQLKRLSFRTFDIFVRKGGGPTEQDYNLLMQYL